MIKIIKRAGLVLFLVVVMALALSSCTKDDGLIKYKSVKGGYEVVGVVDKNAESVVIPESFNGKSVVGIADEAFRGTNIQSISIPSSVKSIGLNAFEYCLFLDVVELSSADLMANVKLENIYSSPFNNGAALFVGGEMVTELKINGGKISDYAYAGCTSIEELVLFEVEEIGVGSFKDCVGLKAAYLDSKLVSIGANAFSGNALGTVTIPKSCVSIGHSAFSYNSQLRSVILPDSITKIADRTFSNCGALEIINLENIVEIGGYAFYNCESMTTLDLSAKTLKIEEYAFYNCGLTVVNIPEDSNLEFIGEAAFRGCTALEEIYLDKAKSLVTIGKSAFEYCEGLTDLTLPSSLEELGDWAFSGCDNLKYNIQNGVGYIGNHENRFIMLHKYLDQSKTKVSVSDKTKFIHTAAFKDAKSLTSVRMIASVRSIGSQAFAFCTSLEELILPKSLRIIGDGAIMGCKAISSVKFMGTSDQWNKSEDPGYVKKGTNWKYGAGKYSISYNYVAN